MKKRGVSLKYTKEVMAAAISDYETSELSQQEVCDKHQITLGPFKYAWKKHLAEQKQRQGDDKK